MDLCQYAERKLTAHSGRKWPYDSRLTITHGSSANLTLGITSRLPVNWELAEQWILTSLLPNTNCQLDPRTRSFLIADDSFLIAGMRVTEFLPALFPS